MKLTEVKLFKLPIDNTYENVFDGWTTIYDYVSLLEARYPHLSIVTPENVVRSVKLTNGVCSLTVDKEYFSIKDYNYCAVYEWPAAGNPRFYFITSISSLNDNGTNPSCSLSLDYDVWANNYLTLNSSDNKSKTQRTIRKHIQRYTIDEQDATKLHVQNYIPRQEMKDITQYKTQDAVPDRENILWLRVIFDETNGVLPINYWFENHQGSTLIENLLSAHYSSLFVAFYPVALVYKDGSISTNFIFNVNATTPIGTEILTIKGLNERPVYSIGDLFRDTSHIVNADYTFNPPFPFTYSSNTITVDGSYCGYVGAFEEDFVEVTGSIWSTKRRLKWNIPASQAGNKPNITSVDTLRMMCKPSREIDSNIQKNNIITQKSIYGTLNKSDFVDLRVDARQYFTEPVMNMYPYRYKSYECGAIKHDIVFDLSNEDFQQVIKIRRFAEGESIFVRKMFGTSSVQDQTVQYTAQSNGSLVISKDKLDLFLAENGNTWALQKFKAGLSDSIALLSGSMAIAKGAASKTPKLKKWSIAGKRKVNAGIEEVTGATSLLGAYSKERDLANAPDIVSIPTQYALQDFILQDRERFYSIDWIIDFNSIAANTDFNRYGYVLNRDENVISCVRLNFDYCQTEDCSFPVITNNEEREVLERIFNTGVTKWHLNEIGTRGSDDYKAAAKSLSPYISNPEKILFE